MPDESMNEIDYLMQANSQSEWMLTLYSKYVVVVIVGNLVMIPASAVISSLINGNFEADDAYHISRILLVFFFSNIRLNGSANVKGQISSNIILTIRSKLDYNYFLAQQLDCNYLQLVTITHQKLMINRNI